MGMTIYRDNKPVILIDKHIGEDPLYGKGITEGDFVRELNFLENSGEKECEVWVNSIGGSVIDAWGIYNAIVKSTIKVTTRNVGMAASAAGWIIQGGKYRICNYYAPTMMHNSSGGDDKALNAINESIISILASRCNKSENWVKQRMAEETWISPDDALSYGFYDEIDTECGVEVKERFDNKTPIAAYNKLKLVVNKLVEQPKKEIQMKKVTNKLGLLDNANEESILAGIEAIENKLTAKTKEADGLKNDLDSAKEDLSKKEAELTALKKEKQDAEDAAKIAKEEAIKNQAKTMIERFAKEGRIKNDKETIDKWTNKAIADLDGTKELIEGLPINKTGVKIINQTDSETKPYNMAAVMAEITNKSKTNNK